MGIFKSIMAFVLTTYLFRYSKALKGYLDNESLGNLDRSMETQAALFFVFSFLATISSIIYVVFA